MVRADSTINIRIQQGGTWLQLVTQPWPSSVDTIMFHRIFWTFPPCVETFKYCKPLIFIDDIRLYGKYRDTLLMVIAQDGNANILPIEFAVVEGEMKEAWSFFLLYLQQHVTPQSNILVISDRHKSINVVLNIEENLWKPPHAFQAFCIRHIVANFMTHFKNKDLKKVLFDLSRTTFTVEDLTAVPGSRQQNYQVLLDEGKCDCGYFQALHVPYHHDDESEERSPRQLQISYNMDEVEYSREKRCGLGHQVGHTRRTCTALDGGGPSSS
ncbi:hypothetical protein AHAS_Ahas08G0159100 [Arachis hypogaea]